MPSQHRGADGEGVHGGGRSDDYGNDDRYGHLPLSLEPAPLPLDRLAAALGTAIALLHQAFCGLPFGSDVGEALRYALVACRNRTVGVDTRLLQAVFQLTHLPPRLCEALVYHGLASGAGALLAGLGRLVRAAPCGQVGQALLDAQVGRLERAVGVDVALSAALGQLLGLSEDPLDARVVLGARAGRLLGAGQALLAALLGAGVPLGVGKPRGRLLPGLLGVFERRGLGILGQLLGLARDHREHPGTHPGHRGRKVALGEARGLLVVGLFEEPVVAPLYKLVDGHGLLRRHQLIQVGLGAGGVEVEHALGVLGSAVEVAVGQEEGDALEQGAHAARGPLGGHGDLSLGGARRSRRRPLVLAADLLDAAHQVLHEAQLGHVLRLQVAELLGQVVGVHVEVRRDQGLLGAGLDEGQVAAPLVAHPGGVEVLGARPHHHHRLGALQGRVDVGLVGLAQLVLQRDGRVEHAEALGGERVVELGGLHAVARAPALGVALLVADEDIEGLLLGGNLGDALLDGRDGLGLPLVDAALHHARVREGLAVVLVGQDGAGLHAVDRGHLLAGGGVAHVLHAVAAQHHRPVRLGVGGVLGQHGLEHAHGLVVLAGAAEVVAAVVEVGAPLVVQAGQGLLGVAVVAGHGVGARRHLERGAAHLALEGCHGESFGESWGNGKTGARGSHLGRRRRGGGSRRRGPQAPTQGKAP